VLILIGEVVVNLCMRDDDDVVVVVVVIYDLD